jgi:DNA-directed RNA polymerase subunit RPC12/RpoP
MTTSRMANYVCDRCGARFVEKPDECECGDLWLEDL